MDGGCVREGSWLHCLQTSTFAAILNEKPCFKPQTLFCCIDLSFVLTSLILSYAPPAIPTCSPSDYKLSLDCCQKLSDSNHSRLCSIKPTVVSEIVQDSHRPFGKIIPKSVPSQNGWYNTCHLHGVSCPGGFKKSFEQSHTHRNEMLKEFRVKCFVCTFYRFVQTVVCQEYKHDSFRLSLPWWENHTGFS